MPFGLTIGLSRLGIWNAVGFDRVDQVLHNQKLVAGIYISALLFRVAKVSDQVGISVQIPKLVAGSGVAPHIAQLSATVMSRLSILRLVPAIKSCGLCGGKGPHKPNQSNPLSFLLPRNNYITLLLFVNFIKKLCLPDSVFPSHYGSSLASGGPSKQILKLGGPEKSHRYGLSL